ncbi:MAG TPA: hypothetical protein VGI64_15890 [Streptosporangiaceae bacterium]
MPIWMLVGVAPGASAMVANPQASTVTSSSLGNGPPTFVGTAATGCASGCNLLTGPFATPSTASFTPGSAQAKAAARAAKADIKARNAAAAGLSNPAAMTHALPSPMVDKNGQDPPPPSVNCDRPGTGCDQINMNANGAKGVKGLNAVDSGTLSTNPNGDIEPADQGLCAGNGFVVEANNLGEVLFFNTKLSRVSSVIPLDTLMGLTARGWSSGGDIMCQFDPSNGGHFIFTEFASASTEASGGPFSGCFAGVANTCFEGIAVTKGNNPFGPYNVYFLNANYNPAEPGAPFLLNDFTKIAVTRDAFELFYDEFPQVTAGIGGGGFNGAQEFAFDKNALEHGLPVTLGNGKPNPAFNVAIENMGLLATPDGTCASDNIRHRPGITCWFSVIPAMPPDAAQFDNSHGGSGFMLDTLDFRGQGDNRIAVFDWTGLSALDSANCAACGAVTFGGQLFSGTNFYFGEGVNAPQKTGPIPLGDECGAAGLSTGANPPASCPEGGIATNGDNFTQASQSQGQLWGAISTETTQSFAGEATGEVHQGAAFWEIGTKGFDQSGVFTLTSQGYVSPAHEDLSMPDIAAPDHGPAALFFTLTGNGGPAGADNGGFFPSTAFGRLGVGASDLNASKVSVADLGQAPEDGFGEYQGFPGRTSPRWGDYSAGVYDPGSNKIFFSTNYIQFPNCAPPQFTLALATCGGTRDGFANWGTSVNSVSP